MEDKKAKPCRACRHFDAYYTKGAGRFKETDCGGCKIGRKTVKRDFTCANWQPDGKRRERRRLDARKTLDDILEEIEAIAYILKEEKDG